MSEPQWLDNFSQSSTAGMADSIFTDNLMDWIVHLCSAVVDCVVHSGTL